MPHCRPPPLPTRAARAHRAALVAALLAAAPLPGRANGTFFQLDSSDRSTTGVYAIERGRLQFGLARADWSGGFHWTGQVTWKFTPALGLPLVLRVGPAAQYSHVRQGWAGGGALVAESYNPTGWGSVFLIGNYSTIQAGYFAMVQLNHRSGVSLELAASGNNDGYRDQTVALGYRFRNTPFSLRLGRKIRAEETFLGFSINTY